MKFFGRTMEVDELRGIRKLSRKSARMTVVTGRRRVGKTELVRQALDDGGGIVCLRNNSHSDFHCTYSRAKRGLKMSGAGEGQEVLHGTPGTAKRHSLRMSRHDAERSECIMRANPR